jgi:hypothetical protein
VLENRTGRLDPLEAATGESAEPRLALPPGGYSYVMARIRTRASESAWKRAVDVYIRNEGGVPSVVGIEREE